MSRPEGEITRAEVLATSLEAFGQENYGQLAADIMGTVQRASWINVWQDQDTRSVHGGFAFSPYHFGDEISVSEKIFEGSPSLVPMEAIEAALLERMANEELFFDYMFVANPERYSGYRYPIAHMIPLPWQKGDLARFMTRPGPGYSKPEDHLAAHSLTGATGRALDVLSLVSGVKTEVDPIATEAGVAIDYDEFRNGYLKRKGVTPAVRTHLHDTLRVAVMREAMHGTNASPSYGLGYDAAIEGDSHIRGVGFSKTIEIDQISVSSLKTLGERAANERLRDAIASL